MPGCHAIKAGDARQEQIRVAAEGKSESSTMTVLDLCESGAAASELGLQACVLFCFSLVYVAASSCSKPGCVEQGKTGEVPFLQPG